MSLNRIQYPSPGFSQHWKQPAGKSMLRRVNALPGEKDIHAFSDLYLRCDEAADRVVVDLFEKMSHKQGHAILNTLLQQGPDSIVEMPDSLRKLYKESLIIPEWVDENLLKAGAAFCQRAGVLSLIVLRN